MIRADGRRGSGDRIFYQRGAALLVGDHDAIATCSIKHDRRDNHAAPRRAPGKGSAAHHDDAHDQHNDAEYDPAQL